MKPLSTLNGKLTALALKYPAQTYWANSFAVGATAGMAKAKLCNYLGASSISQLAIGVGIYLAAYKLNDYLCSSMPQALRISLIKATLEQNPLYSQDRLAERYRDIKIFGCIAGVITGYCLS